MKQTFMKFIDNEETEEAELFIYGDIVDMAWWEEDVTANDIRKQLDETNAKTITVHINSLGGDTFTGVAIYNLLKEKSKTSKIVTYVDAIAASAASIIAMAGNKIVMPSNTLMMIHNCWTLGIGNANELRKVASDMDKIMDAVIQCYLSKINITEDELRALLDEETYLTAQEALEKGFCDEIVELKEDSTGVNQNALSSLVKIIKNSKNVNETNIIVSNKIIEKEIKNESDKPSLFNLK
ncbi:MAG: Clp protease ClpP [Bacilli bacterium]|nr:Clp protease ClpP [Bacilli bacterium]